MLYVLVTVGSLLLCGFYYRLWDARLEIPLQYSDKDDAQFCYYLVKTINETGWFQENPRLSAPGTLQLYDLPFDEHMQMGLLKLIGTFAKDYGLTVNLFYLATFPLASCTSLFAMRRLGVSAGCSLAGSLLFAFLPFHFLRGQVHLFYSAYFAVPLVALMLIELYRGRPLLFRDRPGRWIPGLSLPGRFALGALIACVLIAYSGVYFAFFGCVLCAVAGLGILIDKRSVAGLLNALSAGGLIGVLMVAGLIPNYFYWKEHGKNTEVLLRPTDDLQRYSLKFASLAEPYPYHNFRLLKALMRRQAAPPLATPDVFISQSSSDLVLYLGVASLIGLAILLGVLFRTEVATGALATLWPVSRLSLGIILIGMPYGLGHLFGVIVSSKIRAYNRISIFLGFYAILALVLVIDHAWRRYGTDRRSRFRLGSLLTVATAFFLFEQMPPALRPDHAALAADFDNHRAFYGAIEKSLPPGSMIFQLPYVKFPEGSISTRRSQFFYRPYQNFRAFLHTDTLRWSGAPMRGREIAQWQDDVTHKSTDVILDELRTRGFAGLTVDRDGYEDEGAEIERELRKELGVEPLKSTDGRLFYYPIEPKGGPSRDQDKKRVAPMG